MFELFMAWMFIKFVIVVSVVVAIVAMAYINGKNKRIESKMNDTRK